MEGNLYEVVGEMHETYTIIPACNDCGFSSFQSGVLQLHHQMVLQARNTQYSQTRVIVKDRSSDLG